MEHELYTIGHITIMTGLTDRTIRRHIAAGFLTGEKINGVWHFTPEQVEAFMRHPAVRPGIVAKQNAVVYDFLLDTKKQTEQICLILDAPDAKEKPLYEHFAYAINNGSYRGISFTFESLQGQPRVILRGNAKDVLELVNTYYEKRSS